MNKKSVLIIGYGVVGHNLAKELEPLQPDVVDKYKKDVTTIQDIEYDVGFICVDTPLKSDNTLDTTEVKNAIQEYPCKVYCIKSTCPVGTVDQLKKETGKRIIFSPEYYGGTKHCNNYTFDFTILGGEKKDCEDVLQILLPCYDGRHSFRMVDAKLAELVKFMENSFLATKVSFCQSFFEICNILDLNYDELRELFILDPRVNPSHTFVYQDTPFWNSHCLNKDVSEVANRYSSELLQSVISFNQHQKDKYLK